MKTEKLSFLYEDEEYEFEMRNRISFGELSMLCHNVIGEMFCGGEYFPEFRDYSMWKEIINAYTSIELWDDAASAENIDKNYELIFGSNLCDVIRSFAGEQIDRQIEEYVDKLEQRELNKTKLDSLIEEVLEDPSVIAAIEQLGKTLEKQQEAN